MTSGKETPTMLLISERLRNKTGLDFKAFIMKIRSEKVDAGNGTMVDSTWDDVAYFVRLESGVRVTRESVRTWAIERYEIPEPEHDYGMPSESADVAPVAG